MTLRLATMSAEPLQIDFRPTFHREVVAYDERGDLKSARPLAVGISDADLAAMRATYTSTGGNVSETARYHDVGTHLVQSLSHQLEWPVYGTEVAEKSHRVHMRKVMTRLETRMMDLADSLEVETKSRNETAMMSKRELSLYLEPLSSRHSAFKTVFDAWMRLGSILYPEDFARDPDPDNWRAAEQRSQVRDLALLGGIAGLKRSMEDVLSRHFLPGIPDRDREDPEEVVVEAQEVSDDGD